MNTKTFNENYTIDRKAKGVKATAKNGAPEPEIKTANGENYNADQTYYFFDESSREVRTSTGFRRTDEYLCAFGLRIVAVVDLYTNRDEALSAGQRFFNAEIENLRERIRKYEAEKQPVKRSLKAVLMSG